MSKVAVVTGASHGIGRGMAIGLAQKGYEVIGVARSQKGLDETVQRIMEGGGKARAIIVDVTNWDSITTNLNDIPQVDLLYNGVANWVDKPLATITIDELKQTIDTVYTANILVTKYLLPKLQTSHGMILNMVSDWGFPDAEAPSPHGSAKAGFAAFGNMLRKELKPDGVRVINIYPTVVASGQDIADTTPQPGSILLSELVPAVLDTLEKSDISQIRISHLKKDLEVQYS